MSEQNKELIRRIFDVMNTHDLGSLDELVAGDATWTNMGEGLEGIKEGLRAMLHAFPDASVTMEDVVAEGDRVAVYSTCSGTHMNDYAGLPATGKPFKGVEQVDLFRIQGGKVIEARKVNDNLSFLQQIGLIPAE